MITRKDAGTRLGVSTSTIDKLAACGLLDTQHLAHLVLFDEAEIDTLVQAKDAKLGRPAIVVRLAAPDVARTTREGKPYGWHQSWSDEDKMDAARKDLGLRLQGDGRGSLLLAEVSDWIVGAWMIQSGNRDGGNGWCFDVAVDTTIEIKYVGRRLALGRGRAVVTLPSSGSST